MRNNTDFGDFFRALAVILAIALTTVLHVKAKPSECDLCDCRGPTLDCSATTVGIFKKVLQFKLQNYTDALFTKNQIETITTPFPRAQWRTLMLNDNKIMDIRVGVFQNLISLEVLDLSHNMLTSKKLSPHIFKGLYAINEYEPMRSLKVLHLGHNSLHTLHPDVFEHLPNLEYLSLTSNPLKHIDKATVIAFSSIPHLQALDLSNTMIDVIPELMLHSPVNLNSLNLSRNNFTTVPTGLVDSHALKHLVLDGNPIEVLSGFPPLPKLEVLHISWMPLLRRIEERGFNGLPALQELHCSHNGKLTEIHAAALSAPVNDEKFSETWPPLKKLILDNNKLEYLDQAFTDRWEQLEEIELRKNSWSCDCQNQWLVTYLIPLIGKFNLSAAMDIICELPKEMKGYNMRILAESNYDMRCLDYYGHQPEGDGALLIWSLAMAITLIPLLMGVILHFRRFYVHRGRGLYFKPICKPADRHLFI